MCKPWQGALFVDGYAYILVVSYKPVGSSRFIKVNALYHKVLIARQLL
jgi:hypothetical protein